MSELKRGQVRLHTGKEDLGLVRLLGECIGGPRGVFEDGWNVEKLLDPNPGFAWWVRPEDIGREFNDMEALAWAAK